MRKSAAVGSLSGRIGACVLVLACVAIGIIGLVLPIIPGLLFLAVAALIVARQFPSVESRIRRHRVIDRHLETADGFARLSLADKIRVAGLYCVKMLLDGAAVISSFVSKPDGARR